MKLLRYTPPGQLEQEGEVSVGAMADKNVSGVLLDTHCNHHSIAEINEDTPPSASVPSPGPKVNGSNICDSDNKIVIKARQTVANEPVQDPQLQQCETNDVEDVQQLYDTNPEAFRQWLLQRAPSDLLTRLRHHGEAEKPFASSDLFHRWIAFSPTKVRGRSSDSYRGSFKPTTVWMWANGAAYERRDLMGIVGNPTIS